jgi:hypothetical protein
MASYGKGKGRNAGRYRAAAHDAMRTAQGAVPAWVMPISQVAEMVSPKRDAFDVVIVDEASQAGMDALFLLWLAPRVIVVGDDKQCAPPVSSMGRLQAIQDRLLSHLPDMPPMLRQLYTPATNLYGTRPRTRNPTTSRKARHDPALPSRRPGRQHPGGTRFCLFGQRRVQMRMPARWSAAW